jgi:RNA 2',3'-cyclic 3'-phosphodiesterase
LSYLNRIRTFIALDVSNKTVIEKLQAELANFARWSRQEVKPIEKQNFHFTLIFLGEVDLSTVDKIKGKLSELQFEPIKISYTGLGGFPNPSSARVVWMGVDEEGGKTLISLADKVASKMADIGLRSKQPFSPHITLFRIKRAKLNISQILSRYNVKNIGPPDIIDKIHMKRSTLTQTGPIYSNIFTVYAK